MFFDKMAEREIISRGVSRTGYNLSQKHLLSLTYQSHRSIATQPSLREGPTHQPVTAGNLRPRSKNIILSQKNIYKTYATIRIFN